MICDVKLEPRETIIRLKQYWTFARSLRFPLNSFLCFRERKKKQFCTKPHIQSFRNCWEARNRKKEERNRFLSLISVHFVLSLVDEFCLIFKWRVFSSLVQQVFRRLIFNFFWRSLTEIYEKSFATLRSVIFFRDKKKGASHKTFNECGINKNKWHW